MNYEQLCQRLSNVYDTGEAKAIVFCDDRGFYSVGMMPVGLYSISVVAEGKSLHYAELQLAQS